MHEWWAFHCTLWQVNENFLLHTNNVNIAACADAEEQIQGGQHNLVQEAACQCVPVSTHIRLHSRSCEHSGALHMGTSQQSGS